MNLLPLSLISEQAKLRVGLSHIRDLKHEHVKHLLGDGHYEGHVTEKSDGMAFEVGHDEHGPYTRTSHSDKMRKTGDYGTAARKKFGPGYDPKISGHFDSIHHHLTSNPKLMSHLRKHGSLKGEIFHRPQGTPVDKHHVRFVGTAYDTRKMGSEGSFIAHTKLAGNEHAHKVDHLSDHAFNFDTDSTGHKVRVGVKDLHSRFHALNSDILHSRKHADREGKEHEKRKFDGLKNEIHARVSKALSHLSPKWGPETEGHVIHPTNPNAPRVKIVDGNFMARKNASAKFVKEEVIEEGGNVHIGDQKTVPIQMKDRDAKAKDVDEFMHSVNKHSGGKIFGKKATSLHTLTAYSGSSRHMMDKSIPTHEFARHKKSFGDVDVMAPHEAEEHVVKAMQPGTKHGKFTVQGLRKIGAQHSAVVKHADGSHHQVDFEYKEHDKNHEPTKYSQWSQNSHYGDMKKGLKGVYHKHLVNAVTAAHSKPGILQTHMKKGIKHEDIEARAHTFAPTHGMRPKHIPTLDEKGKHVHIGGKPVYHEVGSKDATYDRDLGSIHHKLFGSKASSADTEHLHSFHGTAHLIKKHFDHGQRHKIIKSFVNKLYGTEGRPHEDHDRKDHAIDSLKHHFPENFNKDMHDHIKHQRKVFFDKHKIHEGVEKKDLHIAMAAGRFTGPTKEHQKLIDNVLAHKADHHHIFVMGPSEPSKTTAKDPLTVHEKIHHLKKLYPDHKHVFVPGTTIHTKTPAGALSWMHFRHKDNAKSMHLHVFAGKGDEGVEKNAGGSIDSYKHMVGRLNHTSFPERVNEHGKKVGGDKRMEYKSTTFHAQDRGTTSGSKIRKHAYDSDPNNHEHVEHFRSMLHSGVTHDHAKEIMHQIKHFKTPLNENLTALQRQHSSRSVQHNTKQLHVTRRIKKFKMATDDVLHRRADRAALRQYRDNALGLSGKSYSSLTSGQKIFVDNVISRKKDLIGRLATSLYNSGTIRRKEHARLQRAYKVAPPIKLRTKLHEAYDVALDAYELVAEEAK